MAEVALQAMRIKVMLASLRTVRLSPVRTNRLVLVVCALALMSAPTAAFGQGQQSAETDKRSQQETLGLRGVLPVPTQIEPAASDLDRSHGQQWHRVNLLLSGSMCPACLLELEGKLRALPGVNYAKIIRELPGETPGAHKKHPSAILIYDKQAVGWDQLQQCIKTNKYQTAETNDIEMQP